MKKTTLSMVCLAMTLLAAAKLSAQALPSTEKGSASLEPVMHIALTTGTGDMNSFLKTVYADARDMGAVSAGIGFRTGYFLLDKFESYIKILAARGTDFKAPQGSYSFVHNWGAYVGVEYYFGNIKDLVSFSANVGIGCEAVDYSYTDMGVHYVNGVVELGATVWLTRLGINLSYTPSIVKGAPKTSSLLDGIPEMGLNNVSLGLRFRF